jgi:hypothetical protein
MFRGGSATQVHSPMERVSCRCFRGGIQIRPESFRATVQPELSRTRDNRRNQHLAPRSRAGLAPCRGVTRREMQLVLRQIISLNPGA